MGIIIGQSAVRSVHLTRSQMAKTSKRVSNQWVCPSKWQQCEKPFSLNSS